MTETINPRLMTPLVRAMGMRNPIFAFCHGREVVSEVSRHGGLGVLGATRHTPEEIAEDLKWIRAQVGRRPFGVNLVLPSGMPEDDNRAAIEAQLPQEHRDFVRFLYEKYKIPQGSGPGMRSRFVRSQEMAQRQMQTVLDSDVDVVACGIGAPDDMVKAFKQAGKKVIALVGSPKHARGALTKPLDALVAQGYDAGAHTGSIGTFSLLPQIVDMAQSVHVPVLAAGGVATGRHIVAALAMGAQGVWMGTAWLTTEEYRSHLPDIVFQKLLAASIEDTVISRADSGKTLRQVRTAWSDEWESSRAPRPLKMPLQDILIGDLLGAIDEHEVAPLMHSPAGQSVGYFNSVETVGQRMDRLLNEAQDALF
jgi:NAD(P)H-dependent flavin oxidoreductase YrpB (nitropropane dioxygenase family)